VERKIFILIKMGKINLDIDDNLEKELRKIAVEKFEARKGFLKKAVEEAIRDWIRKNSKGVKNV
jgi:tryptophan synthase beta subunit